MCNRAVAKERHKPLSIAKKNKICQACLLCRSLPLCPTCQHCPSCCRKSSSGRLSATFLEGLALPGCESKGGIHTERRLLTSFQDKTTPVKVTSHCQPLLRCSQKQTSEGIFTGSDSKTSCRKGHGPFFPGVLQPVISGSKTQQQVEAHPRPQSTEFVPSVSLLQNGNPRGHQTLPSKRGVGHIAGFQRRLLSCSHKSKVAEIPQVSSQWPNLSIHCPPFRPVHGSVGIHQGRQGGQIDGTVPRYPDPPVPRRLVGEGSLSGSVQASYPDPLGSMSQTRLDCQYDKVRAVSPTGVQLCRLPFRPLSGLGQTNAGKVVHSVSKDQSSPRATDLLGQAIHVPHWASNGYRETGGFGTPSHEAYSVAFKEVLACPRGLREDNPHSKVPPCSPEMVVRPGEGPEGSTSTPVTACPSALYRRLKRRLGRTLRRLHGKRPLVQVRRRIAHKFARTQGGPFSPKTVRAVVLEPDHSGLYGIHDSGGVHQQGRGYEVRFSLCSPLETPSVVQPKADCFTSQTYSRSPECHCRQAVPVRTGNSDGMVAPSRGFQPPLQEMAQTGNRLVCDKVQSQASQVCFPGSGQIGLGSRCAESSVERSGRVCLPPDSPYRSSDHKVVGPRLSLTHLDCTRMAQLAMVLGSGQSVSSSSPLSATGGELVDSTVQSMLNLNLHAWLLEPRPSNRPVSLSKWQQELRLLRDAQPEQSTSQSGLFLLDGARTIRWTSGLLL